jgi:hypothetical protein
MSCEPVGSRDSPARAAAQTLPVGQCRPSTPRSDARSAGSGSHDYSTGSPAEPAIPAAAAGPLHGLSNVLRMLQHLTEIPPDQLLQRFHRVVAGRAAIAGNEQAQLGLGAAQVAVVGWWQTPPGAATPTAPAANKTAQQIWVHPIVTCCHMGFSPRRRSCKGDSAGSSGREGAPGSPPTLR